MLEIGRSGSVGGARPRWRLWFAKCPPVRRQCIAGEIRLQSVVEKPMRPPTSRQLGRNRDRVLTAEA